LAEGEFALATQALELALTTQAEWIGDHDIYAMLADTATQQRDEIALRRYAPLLEELALRYGHLLYQAIAYRAWGVAHRLAGEYPESEQRLQQALDIFGSLGTRWQLGRTHFAWGELAATQGDGVAARNHFTQAQHFFAAMQAAPDLARTHKALAELA
jgi:hypothetical protein